MFQIRQFRGRQSGPHLLITAGVHGDEFESMAAVRRLIRRVNADAADPAKAKIRGRLTLVPVVNEAAFLRGHRMAEDNLDLARTFPGRADGSVTERVAHALTPLIRDADFYVDLHTGGTEFAVLPLAGYTMHPEQSVLEQQRRMAQAFNLPIVWGTNPHLQGRTMSVARDARTPAIYAEYLGSATCDSRGVDAYEQGCLNVMAELGMIDEPRPESRVRHVVEDERPESGHMQVCNPSPITGYFHPGVQLGEAIRAGDPIGTVCDVTGETTRTIHSRQTGIVLVLRTFPRVREGDSVGVILDLP